MKIKCHNQYLTLNLIPVEINWNIYLGDGEDQFQTMRQCMRSQFVNLAVKVSVVTGLVDPPWWDGECSGGKQSDKFFYQNKKPFSPPVRPVIEGCSTSTEVWTSEQFAVIGRGQGASTLGPTWGKNYIYLNEYDVKSLMSSLEQIFFL